MNLPPGPREWGTNWRIRKASWNGTLPRLAGDWALKYGDITFANSFGLPLVFLNSAEVTRKLLASEKYKLLMADRLPNAASRITQFNGKDLVFSRFDGTFNVTCYSIVVYSDRIILRHILLNRRLLKMIEFIFCITCIIKLYACVHFSYSVYDTIPNECEQYK